MAYSLNDPYRLFRLLMRIDGATLGPVLGLAMMTLSWRESALLGIGPLEPAWTTRLAGAMLLTLGVFFMLAAAQSPPTVATLVAVAMGNSLVAIVLLIAYLQQELERLTLLGQMLLILLFVLCLVSAVFSIRYMRSEARYM